MKLIIGLLDYSYFLIFIFIIFFILLLVIIKRTVVNIYDPTFWFAIIFIIPGLFGFFASIFVFGWSFSFAIISIFIGVFFVIINFFPIRNVDLRDHVPKDFQIFLLLFGLIVLLLHIYINMIVPGKIPILMTNGVDARFESTENSRLLTWLMFTVSSIPTVIFSISQYRNVRRFALFCFVVDLFGKILFATKGVILSPIILELTVLFISHARGDYSRFKKHKRNIFIVIFIMFSVLPIYLLMIGFFSFDRGGINILLIKLVVRFFYGFDQLIPAGYMDMINYSDSALSGIFNSNLIEYQFLPYFKVIGFEPNYSSVGQFVVYQVYGELVQHAYTFPNSNLILESLFTSGIILGIHFFVIEMSLFYLVRKIYLNKPITALNIPIFLYVIYTPYSLFMSGQSWASQCLLFVLVNIFLYCSYRFLLAVTNPRGNYEPIRQD
ncbi:hypothetical protein [Vibrio mangrovi]|uniref:Uncharacterized protein n=1 Tax=Vibrio mangrovi TaxID=474394 RepID=A0A1Y6IV53_9VIBR|nr:hypothetical protein [Vibrio mangrovi]MDW6002161.1 hypothetical protein [Vibrio mangrovi]SMS01506.1 hypothetical protein VIM7927_02802 [Vibrio mangrovi]